MKIAIVYFSTYGHTKVLADAVKRGVDASGLALTVDFLQVPEALSEDALRALHAPPKATDIPLATPQLLCEYDAFLFGVPTRFGAMPAQWIDFWGQTAALWQQGALLGKPAAFFVSTGSPHGGQESTIKNSLSILVHHGMTYVPLGYANLFAELANMDEVHGSSAWGAGAYAALDGSRQPTELELQIATNQGALFAKTASKLIQSSVHLESEKVAVQPIQPDTVKEPAETKQPQADVVAITEPQKETANSRTEQSSPGKPEKEFLCKCIIV